jgi:glycosyltransferase involved in cell wall biosynthesis
MKLVQINRNDLIGGRFNGYAIRRALREYGIESTHLIWNEPAEDPQVKKFLPFPGSRAFVDFATKVEKDLSMHSMLQVQSFGAMFQKEFREADIVHYHIIHDGYFSLHALPWLTHLKPSVWTWHDPWPMTGHCIYPLSCDGWERAACSPCPHLERHFPLKEDKADEAFRTKQAIVAKSDVDIILASQWMMNMARRSPIGRGARLHHVPFGLDLDLYKPRDKAEARKRFGIGEGRVVVALRSISSTFKGLPNFIEALRMMQTDVPLCILALQEVGHFNEFIGRHQIVETGWVNDDELMIDALNAADIFAMPSTAEAFGLMAVEAMACGTPVVVFEGTSLPEVVFAPEAGLAAPMGDSAALSDVLKRLIENPAERKARGLRSRELAEQHYDERLHTRRLAELYKAVASGATKAAARAST